MLLSPFFIFKWQQEYNPFPESWLELLAGVVCVAVFAVTLWLEYKLWCRWGLHLPPPAKPQLRNTYSLYAAAKQEPPPSAEAEAAKRRYKYRSLFPCFLVAVICCSLGTFFSRKDEDFFHAVEYGYFCTADMLLSMGADVDSRGQLAYRCMRKIRSSCATCLRTGQIPMSVTQDA